MSEPEALTVADLHAKRLEKSVALLVDGGIEPTSELLQLLTRAQETGGNPMDLSKEIARQRYRDEARHYLDATRNEAKAAEISARIESAWLERDDLDNLPGPEPLLGTLLFRKNLVVLAGAPGSFKSFVALDWAGSVATGKLWQGHRAQRGTVVYLAGEGDTGLPKRIRAWEKAHNDGRKAPMKVYPLPAALHTPESQETKGLVASIVRRQPDLVVIDTLNRYTPGMNENSAEEMGLFVAVASQIKDQTGACVVIIHHTTKDDGTERGSFALRGASDALYMMKSPNKSRRMVEFYTERSKEEASGGDALKLELDVVDLGADDDGRRITSLVIPRPDPFAKPVVAHPPAAMPTKKAQNLVKLLWNVYVHMRTTDAGWTEAQVRSVVKASDLNLGRYEKQRWPEVWGAATAGDYLTNASGLTSRWFLDVAKVRAEFGFSDEAEDYYREHVMDETPEVPDATE